MILMPRSDRKISRGQIEHKKALLEGRPVLGTLLAILFFSGALIALFAWHYYSNYKKSDGFCASQTRYLSKEELYQAALKAVVSDVKAASSFRGQELPAAAFSKARDLQSLRSSGGSFEVDYSFYTQDDRFWDRASFAWKEMFYLSVPVSLDAGQFTYSAFVSVNACADYSYVYFPNLVRRSTQFD